MTKAKGFASNSIGIDVSKLQNQLKKNYQPQNIINRSKATIAHRKQTVDRRQNKLAALIVDYIQNQTDVIR